MNVVTLFFIVVLGYLSVYIYIYIGSLDLEFVPCTLLSTALDSFVVLLWLGYFATYAC